MTVLLMPPVAFFIYLALASLLSAMGNLMAPHAASSAKATLYAGGEAPPSAPAVPGYRPFFLVALFFAMLHLGVLVLGTVELTPQAAQTAGLYIVGLLIALSALILG